MEALFLKSEMPSKDNFKTKIAIKSPKIILGTGRNLADIDYDALFDNKIKK